MKPWPDDVFDCAKRLARSLGYRLINVLLNNGRVYVNYPTWSDKWRELDPRNPTVWVALVRHEAVNSLWCADRQPSPNEDFFYAVNVKGDGWADAHLGLAVCEAYNALKGNPRWGNE